MSYLYENAIPSAKFMFGKTQMLSEKYAQNSLKSIRMIKKTAFPELKIIIRHNLVVSSPEPQAHKVSL